MRAPTSFAQQLAGGVLRGAIVEPGDGEVYVPSQVVSTVPIGLPLDDNSLPGASIRRESSFAYNHWLHTSGVAAAVGATTLVTLGRGVWLFSVAFSARFTGTENVAGQYRLFLQAPSSGSTNITLAQARYNNGAQFNYAHSFAVTLRNDDWLLQYVRDATIAGDVLYHSALIHALKIL